MAGDVGGGGAEGKGVCVRVRKTPPLLSYGCVDVRNTLPAARDPCRNACVRNMGVGMRPAMAWALSKGDGGAKSLQLSWQGKGGIDRPFVPPP